ncbi:hypothetical protein HZ326_24391, partial [Fusarium oxysporum f. sp. albedinis]
ELVYILSCQFMNMGLERCFRITAHDVWKVKWGATRRETARWTRLRTASSRIPRTSEAGWNCAVHYTLME